MKRVLMCSVAALAILLAGSAAVTKERPKGKDRAGIREGKKKLTAEEKAWMEKLKAMTPEQRRVAMAKRALEIELKPWQDVRKLALSEKATKTVAAIDKIIADKQAQFKKRMEAMEKKETGAEGKRKGEDKPKGEGKRQRGDKSGKEKSKT